MKIDKQYIANNRNKETQTCKIAVEVPWNRTNISAVYSAVDNALPEEFQELGLEVVNYKPISYDIETGIVVLEVEIDVQDIDFEDEE